MTENFLICNVVEVQFDKAFQLHSDQLADCVKDLLDQTEFGSVSARRRTDAAVDVDYWYE